MAVCCPKREKWGEHLRTYLKVFRETRMESLRADWFEGIRDLSGVETADYDILIIHPDFLGKSYGEFSKVMERLCRERAERETMHIWNFGTQIVVMGEREITHLYSEKRKTYVSDGERDYRIRGQLNKEEKQFPDGSFIRIHRNCLVNLAYIRQVEGNYVVLRNGKRLEISIRRKKETVKKIREELSKHGGNESTMKADESTGALEKRRLFC